MADLTMIGRYTIVRCREAGVHAGVLESYSGREAVLTQARQLWQYIPADDSAYFAGLANHGLGEGSRVSEPVERIILTETCAIIMCTPEAEVSIRNYPTFTESELPGAR